MSVPARVTLVTLGVADVARSTAFYLGLGWPMSSASVEGNVSFFQLGGLAFGLFGRQALADDAHLDDAGPGFRGVSLAINLASEAEVDEATASWAANGGTVVKQPERVFWGGYSGYVADPDGHLWELAHNPGFTLTSDGMVQLP